ncbi:Nif3-like dinuclear metal center hexameric protein [Rubrivirga sp. S365]
MPTVRDIVSVLDAWAPPGSAADFDRVGLQVGAPDAEVSRVLVALDLTPAVVDEAAAGGAELVVTHHPLLFKPLGRVTEGDAVGGLAWRLVRAGVSYYALHTNLDAAWGGVSFALAETLGVEDPEVLAPLDGVMRKVVVFAPTDAADAVRAALDAGGAGAIGAYSGASFSTGGVGRFTPGPDARPAIGTAGGAEEAVNEVRIEAVVPSWGVGRVLKAVTAAHPYEEPAVDVFEVQTPATRHGYGVVGRLPAPEPLPAFLARVAERLGAGALRYVGDDAATVERVAVCGGSGLSFLGAALASGADAYVTADVTYHRWFEALGPNGAPRIALVDAGHYETEAMTEGLVARHLRAALPALDVATTRHRTSPMKTFVG